MMARNFGATESNFVPPEATVPQASITVPGFAMMRTRQFPINRRGMEAAERYIHRVLEARGCPSQRAAFFTGNAACMELYGLLRRVRGYLSRMAEPMGGRLPGYGSPDAEEVKKGLASAGAAGFGLMGGLVGAVMGTSLPFKDGWLYGGIAGFLLPMILLAPKKDEAS
jgi:hypothetical protein